MESPPDPFSDPNPQNAWQALRLLRDFFQARADRGDERVALTPRARDELRAVVMRKPARGAVDSRPPAATARKQVVVQTSAPPAPTPAPAPVRPAALPETQRVAKLAALREAAANHAPVLALGTLRDIMVFAVGNPMAEIIFVGEAPGAEEEVKGEPFVGPAGVLLNKMIVGMGLERNQVYISNICKFRPGMPGQDTNNRRPNQAEIAASLTFIEQEIQLIQPKIIIALGATAAEALLGMQNVVVGRVRAKFHDYQGYPVMVTYHPSYLLHNPSMSEKRKVWEDLLKAMERLGMPISDKQRSYFLPKGQ